MRDGFTVIDADGHVEEPIDLWDRYLDKEFRGVAPRIQGRRDIRVGNNRLPKLPGPVEDSPRLNFKRSDVAKRFAFAEQRGFDATSQLIAMDIDGIDQMVLYPTIGLYLASIAELDGRFSSALCRAYNRWLADFCAHDPDRLIGVALGALHDPVIAAADLRDAVTELGMHGLMIRPNPVQGRNLHDPAYDVVWATAAELDVPVAFHEGTGVAMPEYGDRFETIMERHAMSHPVEQMGVVMSCTAGGVMERHPKLQVIILESGIGWLPYWLHRLDEHVEFYAQFEEGFDLTRTPSEYFRTQGWISVEGDEPGLIAALEYVGSDRVLWASDYPHWDSDFPGTTDSFLAVEEVSHDAKRQILHDNPVAAYKL